ncbi:MAG TPA: HNH endonuclease [Ferruginibacter sp.]|jgi:hypothetical protein|nr:HNH endonuclease [Ferruginibacter sp.]
MNDWKIIKQQAEKFLESEIEWKSFVMERRYKVISVNDKNILIERSSGGAPVSLTKTMVNSTLIRIRNEGTIRKEDLTTMPVATAATIVGLHPSLKWDLNARKIIWLSSENTLEQASEFINEASDDELNKVEKLVNQRKFQNKFRKNLLKLYEGKCSVSGVDIEYVLQASHISEHSKSGNNENSNGILLRADLHILFDRSLLLIHPTELTVHLHPCLSNSYYKKYLTQKITERTDKSNINQRFLQEKWNAADWTKSIK